MDNLDFSHDAFLTFDALDPNQQRLSFLSASTWPLTLEQTMSHNGHASSSSRRAMTTNDSKPVPTTAAQPATSTAPLHTSSLGFHQSIDPSAALLSATDWHFQYQQPNQQSYLQDAALGPASYGGTYAQPLQPSPMNFMSTTQAPIHPATMSMDAATSFAMTYSGPMESLNTMAPFQMNDFQAELMNSYIDEGFSSTDLVPATSFAGSSPGESWLDIRSLGSSDAGWNTVDFPQSRRSFESFEEPTVSNPYLTLHVRTGSNSSNAQSDVAPVSAHSCGSWEEISQFALYSPQSEQNLDFSHPPVAHGLPHSHSHSHSHSLNHSPIQATVSPSAAVEALTIKPTVYSTSPSSSSSLSSPPSRRRKSPVGAKVTKTIAKKTAVAHSTKKDNITEKRVGRRRGPLRPDQRQQAHEIRKLRACLRCKFLKKTCDKGDPCAGCQPSHARLWQVPCTRVDIKDIAYFMKDWKADFERHISLGFSVGNIKGFSTHERPLWITHGYGYYLPISAREVFVRDDKCFGMDWVEAVNEDQKAHKEFEVTTAKLSAGMEGVSHAVLSEYLDRHIDGGFERFVDEYFEGTYFLTEILKTAYRYYLREKLPVIRKALKLVVAYNLTLHVTLVDGLSEEEAKIGKIENDDSRFNGKTVAPVMINFQIKCALADMWRELQKDILEELSALYSSVYSGEKLKNWPTIFMLAAILLAVWEEMQFDCHYRVPDPAAVHKFCSDMETTPVGVIVGLFSAISQKLPSFSEWDSRKHHHLLGSNQAVCDAMTEVRSHVTKYETYLKSRADAKFDRNDFDSLSNKFLSKLVIRAN
ncbi:hypothetical protein H2201_008269 [Coniosporium apollinis]|uniref:Zn(2)-C6 fungal-type domain-containing protein n=1 Tax=Coniosporium apollinis TaxID=61459 RepID=A0ABQ9NHE6_9PEZI|nr:hypothetical protein H2201_008269 [Coniosporium apollinis]